MITGLSAILLLGLGLYRFRYAATFFVFCLPFVPRSLGLIIEGTNASLSFSRIGLVILGTIYLLQKVQTQTLFKVEIFDPISRNLFRILLLLACVKIISAITNSAGVIYAMEDMLRTAGVFLIFYAVGLRLDFRTTSRLLLLAFWISALIVVVEIFYGAPIHSAIASGLALNSPQGISAERGMRVQALFDGPLFFAHFLVSVFAAFLFNSKDLSALKKITFLIVFAAIIAANGSRSLVITIIAMVCFWFTISYWREAKSVSRLFVASVVVAIVFSAIWFTSNYIYELGVSGNINNMRELGAFERSSTARAFQFFQVTEVLSGNIFLGRGFQQHFVGDSEMISLDNYYVRLLLESGITGVATFAFFFFTLGRMLLKSLDSVKFESSSRLIMVTLTYTFGTLIFRFFFQDPLGWVLYFCLLGILLRCLREAEKPAV